jgi:alpha-N-arabinofuranosidase
MAYRNPVIPGFHPDPSVCRVGGDYYLATSTFHWFPGVPIFHSRDLAHWRRLGYALTRESQLPLRGAKRSAGIWAPTLRHHAGRFYLITTNKSHGGNFYVTADDPAGPWSEPVWLDADGWDPDLFFDADGKVYYTRTGHVDGVMHLMQAEIDLEAGRLVREVEPIWRGTEFGPEAPHLYRRGGWYYLLIAEGGTNIGHIATIGRGPSPRGPFEPCPHNPILTHRDKLFEPIQACGHGDLVEAPDGSWWMVFLGVRKSRGLTHIFHHLGRETFLAPVRWTKDGWPVVNGGEPIRTPMPVDLPHAPHPWPPPAPRDEFDGSGLSGEWNWLRNPEEPFWSLSERPGFLRLRGRPTALDDADSPALLGRRQTDLSCVATTELHFDPTHEAEEAGLSAFMHEEHHIDLRLVLRDGRRVVQVRRRHSRLDLIAAEREAPAGAVRLRIDADTWTYRFCVAFGSGGFEPIAEAETTYLSTEFTGGFTGVYLALYAVNPSSSAATPADFAWFAYEGRDER